MSSQDLKESHDMEQTSSEPLDWTGNTSKDNLDGGLDNASDSTNTSTHWDELGSYHLDKKAKVTHAPTSSLEASPSDTNSVNSDMMNSSIISDDAKAGESLQPLQARMSPKEDSVGNQTTTPPKERLSDLLHGMSDCGTPDNEPPSPPAKAASYAKYRKSSADLMTLHIFTGKMKGNRPEYIPVYKRDDSGQLLKLLQDLSGRWRYLEPEKCKLCFRAISSPFILHFVLQDHRRGGIAPTSVPPLNLDPRRGLLTPKS